MSSKSSPSSSSPGSSGTSGTDDDFIEDIFNDEGPSFWFWGALDRNYLGLGTMLYTNVLRWASLLFFLLFIIAIPNMTANSRGGRFHINTSASFIAYFAQSTSLANLGSPVWTPGGDNACNGNGFSALVCDTGGWNHGPLGILQGSDNSTNFANETIGLNIYSYECGKAPDWVPQQDVTQVIRTVVTSEVQYTCANKVFMCKCFEGYSGETCGSYNGPFSTDWRLNISNTTLLRTSADVNAYNDYEYSKCIAEGKICLRSTNGTVVDAGYNSTLGQVNTTGPIMIPNSLIDRAINRSLTAWKLNPKSKINATLLAGLLGNELREVMGPLIAATNILPHTLGIKGFCVPISATWVSVAEIDARIAINMNTRVVGVCSGRGQCVARHGISDETTLRYTFCRCDVGFYGQQCEFEENPKTDRFGVISGDGVSSKLNPAGLICGIGSLPWQVHNYVVFSIPAKNCSSHGFGLRFPTTTDGRMSISNWYRKQSPGVCVCEPGFAGEQCLGGAPIPPGSGWVILVQTIIFLLLLTRMYQHRKLLEVDCDKVNIEPTDFTVFAILPGQFDCRKAGGLDIARMRHHFSQWGPVHSIAPGVDDWDLMLLQIEKNAVMKLLHLKLEMEQANRSKARYQDDQRRRRLQLRIEKAARAASRAEGYNVPEPDPKRVREAEIDAIMGEIDWEEEEEENRQKGKVLPPPFDIAKSRPSWYTIIAPSEAEKVFSNPTKELRPAAIPAVSDESLYELEFGSANDNPEEDKEREAAAAAAVAEAKAAKAGDDKKKEKTKEIIVQAGSAASSSEKKNRRVFPTVEISPFTRIIFKLPGTAALFSTRFLRAYGRWLDTQMEMHLVTTDINIFENCFVTFSYAYDAKDCLKSYEAVEVYEKQLRINPHLKEARRAQGLSEGEYFCTSTRTGQRKLVNVDLQVSQIEKIRKNLAPHMPAAVKKMQELKQSKQFAVAEAIGESIVPLRGVEREDIDVSSAMAPLEVEWSALDSTPFDQMILAIIFLTYQVISSFVLFLICFNLTNPPKKGSAAIAATVAVAAMNFLGANQWPLIIDKEENYSVGSKMRSVYFKTLFAQLAITLLSATLATFGLPLDFQNGYLVDFYVDAGEFITQSIFTDTVIEIILFFALIPQRIKLILAAGSKSRLDWIDKHAPSMYKLEFKTAATMRMVIMVCVFSAGCPAILFAGSFSLFVKYCVESISLRDVLRLQRSGPELARALEVTLMISCLALSGMGWVITCIQSGREMPAEVGFLACCSLILWAMLGYQSWKMSQAKDAFFGFGVLPGTNKLPHSIKKFIVPPLEHIHTEFIKFVFGQKFYWLKAEILPIDTTNGIPYDEHVESSQLFLSEAGAGLGDQGQMQTVMSKFSMRHYPYYFPPRTSVTPDLGSPEPLPPFWTGEQMIEWSLRPKRADRIYFRNLRKSQLYSRPAPPLPRSIGAKMAMATGGGPTNQFPKTPQEAVAMIEDEHSDEVRDVIQSLRNEFFHMDKDGDGALSATDAKAARVPQAVFLAILNAVGLVEQGWIDADTFILLKLQSGMSGRVSMPIRQETAHLMIELQTMQAFQKLAKKGVTRMSARDLRIALRDCGLGDAGMSDDAAASKRLQKFDGDSDGQLEESEFFSLLAEERGVSVFQALINRRGTQSSRRIRNLLASIPPGKRTEILGEAMDEAERQTPVSEKSLGFLSRNNAIRALIISVVRSPYYDYATLLLIISNAVVMGLLDPNDIDNKTVGNRVIKDSDVYFASIYTVEAFLKIVCYGAGTSGNGYFADGWNWMDFSLLFIGYLPTDGTVGMLFGSLRVFRLFRLITVSARKIDGVRVIMDSIVKSLPGLGGVLSMMIFVNFVFSLIGLTLWRGSMMGNCGWYDPYANPNFDPSLLGTPAALNNPNATAVLRFIGYDYLSSPQYCSLDCVGKDLFYGACTESFGSTCPAQVLPLTQPNGINTTLVKTDTVCMPNVNPDWGKTNWDNILFSFFNTFICTTAEGWSSVMYVIWNTFGSTPLIFFLFLILMIFGSFFLFKITLAVVWESYEASKKKEESRERGILAVLEKRLSRDEAISGGNLPPPECGERRDDVLPDGRRLSAVVSIDVITSHISDVIKSETFKKEEKVIIDNLKWAQESHDKVEEKQQHKLLNKLRAAFSKKPKKRKDEHQLPIPPFSSWLGKLYISKVPSPPRWLSIQAKRLAEWAPFEYFFIFCVLGNAAMLGLVSYNSSDEFVYTLETVGNILTGLFLFEAATKCMAYGFRAFFADNFNTFDAIVIGMALFEIFISILIPDLPNVGLSSLRVLRVFRMFRLAKNFPGLRRLMTGLANSVSGTVYAILILLLTMYMFGVYGLRNLGGLYESPTALSAGEPPDLNFKTLFWSIVSVFQIIDNENWDKTLKFHMRAFGDAYSIFFILIFLIGNFIFLNLFITILISALNSSKEITKKELLEEKKLEEDELSGRIQKNQDGSLKVGPGFLAKEKPKSTMVSFLDHIKQRLSFIRRQKHVESACLFCMGEDSLNVDSSGGANAKAKVSNPWMIPPEKRTSIDDELSSEMLLKQYSKPAHDVVATNHHDTARCSFTIHTEASGETSHIEIFLPVHVIDVKRAMTPGAVQDLPENIHLSRSVKIKVDASSWRVDGSDLDADPLSSEMRKHSLESESEATFFQKLFRGSTSSAKVAPMPASADESDFDQKSPHDGMDKSNDQTPLMKLLGIMSLRELEADNSIPKRAFLPFFTKDNWYRRLIIAFYMNNYYKWICFVITVISTITCTLDEPRNKICKDIEESKGGCKSLVSVLTNLDDIFTIWFVVEYIMMIVVYGFISCEGSVLRSGWALLDGMVCLVGLIRTGMSSLTGFGPRVLRGLSSLRILRLSSRVPAMRLVVYALINSLLRAGETSLVICLFLYVFAVIGLQLFMGGQFYCNDPSIFTSEACVGYMEAYGDLCKLANSFEAENLCRADLTGKFPIPRSWQTGVWNFDSIFTSILTIFELMTGENWPVIMRSGVDYVGNMLPPVKNANAGAAIFFVLVEIAMNQLLIELFTGVVIDAFLELRAQANGIQLLTRNQRIWVRNIKLILTASVDISEKIPPGSSRFRKQVYALATSSSLEYLSIFVVISYMALISLTHAGQDPLIYYILEYGELGFTCVFLLECMIKLYGLGFDQYFNGSIWHKLDFSVVSLSIISLPLIDGVAGGVVRLLRFLRLLRLLRVARLLRVIRFAKSLKRVVLVFINCLPQFINVLFFLFVELFFFAVMGMNVFAGLRYGGLGYVSSDGNFDTFAGSWILLFRCTTGENFNGIMHEYMLGPPYCIDSGPNANCCPPWISVAFWVIFYITTSMMTINILVATAIEAFDESSDVDVFIEDESLLDDDSDNRINKAPTRLTKSDLADFLRLWSERDSEGTQFLSKDGVIEVIRYMTHPYGVANFSSFEDAIVEAAEGRMVIEEKRISEAKIAAEKREEDDLIQTLDELKKFAKQMRGKPNAAKAAADAAAAEDALTEWRTAHAAEKTIKKVNTGKKTARDLLEEAAAAAMELEKTERARAERNRRKEAMITEMRNMLLMIYAKNKFATLNIVPSKLGLFHFHAVIHALMERATVGVWPLGAKIPSISISSPQEAHVASEMLSIRHIQLIISCQRSFRMRFKRRVARGEIVLKERPQVLQVNERALEDAEQAVSIFDKAIENGDDGDAVSERSGSADGEPEHVSESSKSAASSKSRHSQEEEDDDEEEEEEDVSEDESEGDESEEEDEKVTSNSQSTHGDSSKKADTDFKDNESDESEEASESEEESEDDNESPVKAKK